MISGKKYWSDGTPVAGQQFEYGFDDIGNRQVARFGGDDQGTLAQQSTYTPNALNQYDDRTVPGVVEVIGVADPDSTVKVNGDPGVYRRGEYFRKELGVLNNSFPSISVNVEHNGTNGTAQGGNIFVPPAAEVYDHDDDGNQLSDGRWSYTWDAENRLVQMESLANPPTGSQRMLVFQYDAQGRRIRKTVYENGSSTASLDLKFIYDGWNLLAELDMNDTVVRSYIWGLDISGSMQGAGGVGGLLAVNDGASTHFVAMDGNGNVAGLVNTSGSRTGTCEYDPFGQTIRVTGAKAEANPFRFSAKYTDTENGLLYYGYRYYDPNTGRWFSRDPAEERFDVALYSIVRGDAVNHGDFLGLASFRFEVVTGSRSAAAFSGVWSQPWWAGDGSFSISGSEARSTVTVNNAPAYGLEPAAYCNTVDYQGGAGTSGEIRIYVSDKCGGNFEMMLSFSTFLRGEGPYTIKSTAALWSRGRSLWSGKAAGIPQAELTHAGISQIPFKLRGGKEELIVTCIPTVNFLQETRKRGTSTGTATGYMDVLPIIHK